MPLIRCAASTPHNSAANSQSAESPAADAPFPPPSPAAEWHEILRPRSHSPTSAPRELFPLPSAALRRPEAATFVLDVCYPSGSWPRPQETPLKNDRRGSDTAEPAARPA